LAAIARAQHYLSSSLTKYLNIGTPAKNFADLRQNIRFQVCGFDSVHGRSPPNHRYKLRTTLPIYQQDCASDMHVGAGIWITGGVFCAPCGLQK